MRTAAGISAAGLLVALLFGCASTDDGVAFEQTSILGGVAATDGEYPTVVAVQNNAICTGVLIGRDLVLTAANCISPAVLGYSSQDELTAATSVVVDTVDVYDSDARVISADETMPHPGFDVNGLGDNDIGLIRLAETVTDIEPSPINRVHDDAPVGVVATQVGFGVTDASNQSTGGRLHVVADTPSVSCGNVASYSDANLLCFDNSGSVGACWGDSGAPAFIDVGGIQKVAAVNSFGDNDCEVFGAFSRVDAELDFLDTNAPELACQADGLCTEECGQNGLPEDPDCPECTISDDCGSPDMECVDGTCVPAEGDDGGGGGCNATGKGQPSPAAMLLGVFMTILVGRRRRRGRTRETKV